MSPLSLPDNIRSELVHNIQHRLSPIPIKVRADVDVTCFAYEGIDAIKSALHKGKIVEGKDEVKVVVCVSFFKLSPLLSLFSLPLYPD